MLESFPGFAMFLCVVLDSFVEMYLWKGQYSTKASQDAAMELAQTLVEDRGGGGVAGGSDDDGDEDEDSQRRGA